MRGVTDLGPKFTLHAVRLVMQFDALTLDNDPYGEHNFGAFAFWAPANDANDRLRANLAEKSPHDHTTRPMLLRPARRHLRR